MIAGSNGVIGSSDFISSSLVTKLGRTLIGLGESSLSESSLSESLLGESSIGESFSISSFVSCILSLESILWLGSSTSYTSSISSFVVTLLAFCSSFISIP